MCNFSARYRKTSPKLPQTTARWRWPSVHQFLSKHLDYMCVDTAIPLSIDRPQRTQVPTTTHCAIRDLRPASLKHPLSHPPGLQITSSASTCRFWPTMSYHLPFGGLGSGGNTRSGTRTYTPTTFPLFLQEPIQAKRQLQTDLGPARHHSRTHLILPLP